MFAQIPFGLLRIPLVDHAGSLHEPLRQAERLGDEPRILFAAVSIALFGLLRHPSNTDRTDTRYPGSGIIDGDMQGHRLSRSNTSTCCRRGPPPRCNLPLLSDPRAVG